MKRKDDLRAIDMSDIIYEAVATLVTRPVTDDELVKVITADPDLMVKVLGGGVWVAWCVEHDAAKGRRTGPVWNVCEWRMGNPWPSGKCVWHPQGAFVPDEGNMKVTKH